MSELRCSDVTDGSLLARYVSGHLGDEDLEALESHYLTCDHCYRELRLAIAVHQALEIDARPGSRRLQIVAGGMPAGATPERSSPEAPKRRLGRAARVAAFAAAAVLAGLLVAQPEWLGRDPVSVHRDEAVEATAELRLATPVGEVGAVEVFTWQPVASADLYRVTVYDTLGAVVWQGEGRDTMARLPGDIGLTAGAVYLWEVSARVDWNRWLRSELVRFEIQER